MGPIYFLVMMFIEDLQHRIKNHEWVRVNFTNDPMLHKIFGGNNLRHSEDTGSILFCHCMKENPRSNHEMYVLFLTCV